MSKKRYLDPEKFKLEHATSLDLGEPTEKLIHYFSLIATNFAKIYNNTSKLDRDCIINYAVTQAWYKWNEYDKNRTTNIFAFFTTMISNDMKTHYNTLFDKNKTKGKNYKFVSIEALFAADKGR